MKYADVCILEKTSFNKDYYTYSIPPELEKSLKLHQIVVVPFGKKLAKGVVVALKSSSDYKTKAIKELMVNFPIVKGEQVELIDWMTSFYFTPLPMVMKLLVPKSFPKSLESFPRPLAQKLVLIPTPNFDLSEVTTESSTPQVFHHGLSLSEKQKIWTGVYTGSQLLVIGTRSALFLPFHNLKEILILASESDYYTDKKSPYFNATQVAVKLAKIWNSKLEVRYDPTFKKELDERQSLDLPPFRDLLGLTPVSQSNKTQSLSESLYLSLKSGIEVQQSPIKIYRSRTEKNVPEIFLSGPKLHSFLKTAPKGWRVKVYYLNIN